MGLVVGAVVAGSRGGRCRRLRLLGSPTGRSHRGADLRRRVRDCRPAPSPGGCRRSRVCTRIWWPGANDARRTRCRVGCPPAAMAADRDGAAGPGAPDVAHDPVARRGRCLVLALRTHRDRAMVFAMVLGGLRRCEVLGLASVRRPDRRASVVRRRWQGWPPAGDADLERVLRRSWATTCVTSDHRTVDRSGLRHFEGPEPRSAPERRRHRHRCCVAARATSRTRTSDVPPAPPYLSDRIREAGMALEAVQAQAGHVSIESTRVYLHLTNEWLANEYHKAAELIDAGTPPSCSPLEVATMRPSEAPPAAWAPRRRVQPRVGQLLSAAPAAGRHHAPLSGPAHDVPGPAQRRGRGQHTAPVGPVAGGRDRRALKSPCLARTHIEDYKVWLADQPGASGATLAKNTQRQRLRMIRIFFERLIEWDWPDAPGRNPISHGDIPARTEPLPKFLSDHDAAKLLAAARAHPLPRYRLVVEMLGPHRHAGQRALRPRRRCRHRDRGCLLAAHPRRQAAQRPLDPAAPRARDPARRMDRHQRRTHPTAQKRLDGRRAQPDRPAHGAPDRGDRRPGRPASATSIPTSCATPWPPRPSTGACASKPSPPCSATALWR